jgi:aryl-alcohol dehydrogenase-like predicted oxidoreductase
MRYRKLGSNGPEISVIGFGAWAIGGGMWGGRRDEDARSALARAFDRGVNFYDSALVYGDGHSERLVGEFARARRDQVYVASKVPPRNYTWPARPGARLSEVFPAAWIIECAEKSLKNLGLERIDLLQLHVWADDWTHDDEWHGALEKLRQQGKIRLSGISINSHDPASAVRVVKERRVDALQVFFNIFDQSPEDELFPACVEHGVGVLARVPFDEGSLTGKLRKDSTFPAGDFRSEYFGDGMLEKTVERVEAMRPLVEQSAGTMARGALRFCLSHPAVSTVIRTRRSTRTAPPATPGRYRPRC